MGLLAYAVLTYSEGVKDYNFEIIALCGTRDLIVDKISPKW